MRVGNDETLKKKKKELWLISHPSKTLSSSPELIDVKNTFYSVETEILGKDGMILVRGGVAAK